MSTEHTKPFPEYVGGTLLGQQIGDHYVTTLHGQGPIADVYFANSLQTGERVCIKVMPKDLFKTKVASSRIKKRIDIVTRKLSHPGVDVPIGHSMHPNGQFMVLANFHRGRIVGRIVERTGRMKERTALAIIHLAAGVLAYTHKSGLIHGNLKPNNILLTPEGRMVIIDWASPRSAMLYAQNRIPDGVLRSPEIETGIAYLAPELATGSDDVNPACDVFSLGAVLCYLLSGKPPFGGDPKLVLQKVTYADVPDVIDQIPGIKVSTAGIILHMMNKEPDQRTKDMPAVLAELETQLKPT